MSTNTFSLAWFAAFLPPGAQPAEAELAFIDRHFPVAKFPRLLDVCCGIGRHANALAERGYQVLGIDRDRHAIEVARAAAPPGARYLCMDVRDMDRLTDPFDGAISMWSSFGLLDPIENEALLRSLADRLPHGGRILLDMYNREALGALPPTEFLTRNGRTVHVTRALAADRYRVMHRYVDPADEVIDTFEWVVYDPAATRELGRRVGMTVHCECAWFDESSVPSALHARMQIVLERSRG